MGASFSKRTIVFDASVLINLAVSRHCRIVFKSLNSECIVSPQVLNELNGQSKDNSIRNQVINKLIDQEQLLLVHLNQPESADFLSLVTADETDALDDGEASTIALAKHRNAIAVIDEKKGTRIASSSSPPIATVSTVDLLRWVSTNNTHNIPICDIVVDALVQSKMRVPHEHVEWITKLVPPEIIPKCTSLKLSIRRKALGAHHHIPPHPPALLYNQKTS